MPKQREGWVALNTQVEESVKSELYARKGKNHGSIEEQVNALLKLALKEHRKETAPGRSRAK